MDFTYFGPIGGTIFSIVDTTDPTLVTTLTDDYNANTNIPVAYVDDYNSASELVATYELDNSLVGSDILFLNGEGVFALESADAVIVTPEPSTLTLLLVGLAVLMVFWRRFSHGRMACPGCPASEPLSAMQGVSS